MVLELLINPKKIDGKRWEMFFVGGFYALVAVFLSLWVFRSHASIVMVTFTIIAAIPFVSRVMEIEEQKDMNTDEEALLLREHGKALSLMIFLFLGIVSSFLLAYLVLPSSQTDILFNAQIEAITNIVKASPTGDFSSTGAFVSILLNNLKVLFICIVFSFIYGAGAIFILTWNASVMAAAMGSFIKEGLMNSGGSYVQLTFMSILRYLTHGIPEISAYFIGAIAGGLVSLAVLKQDYKKKKFSSVVRDSLDLTLIAITILFFSALIEVYVTPLLI